MKNRVQRYSLVPQTFAVPQRFTGWISRRRRASGLTEAGERLVTAAEIRLFQQ